jgi:hypothetical protein
MSRLSLDGRDAGMAVTVALLVLGVASCVVAEQVWTSPGVEEAPPSNSVPYAISTAGDSLVRSSSSTPIRRGSVEGYVDNAVVEGKVISVIGWAATRDLGQSAEEVIGVVGGRGLTATAPSVERPDVAGAMGSPTLSRSGFVLRFDKSSLDCSKPQGGLTVLAVAGDTAGPLPWVGVGRALIEKVC